MAQPVDRAIHNSPKTNHYKYRWRKVLIFAIPEYIRYS